MFTTIVNLLLNVILLIGFIVYDAIKQNGANIYFTLGWILVSLALIIVDWHWSKVVLSYSKRPKPKGVPNNPD
jgi:hypothetical protein